MTILLATLMIVLVLIMTILVVVFYRLISQQTISTTTTVTQMSDLLSKQFDYQQALLARTLFGSPDLSPESKLVTSAPVVDTRMSQMSWDAPDERQWGKIADIVEREWKETEELNRRLNNPPDYNEPGEASNQSLHEQLTDPDSLNHLDTLFPTGM